LIVILNVWIIVWGETLRFSEVGKIWDFTQNLKHRLTASYVPPGDNQRPAIFWLVVWGVI